MAKHARNATGTIRVGIGGWVFEPWRGTFYPEKLSQKRELEYAASQLTSIEVNGTYYGAQKPESFARWHDETPDDFVFALKGPRYATNRRVLADAGESIEQFFSGGVMELKDKLGPINWQFMATKKFDPADFEAFLKLLPKKVGGRAIRHVVDVRHESFKVPEFVAMARAYGVAIVVAGDSEYPEIADITAPFVYARIMGTRGEATARLSEKGTRRVGAARQGVGCRQGPDRSGDGRESEGRRRGARRLSLRHQRPQGTQSRRRESADRADRLKRRTLNATHAWVGLKVAFNKTRA